MSSIKHDNNRVSKIRKKKLEEYVEEELPDQSFNRSRSLREKYRGEKKERAERIFSLLDQTAGISTNLSHLTAVHDGQATITRATITTCTHSRSCRISARVATRPITSLLGSEGKGKSLLFLTRGIISGEPMEKWCRGFDLENRGIAIVSCSWRIFIKVK